MQARLCSVGGAGVKAPRDVSLPTFPDVLATLADSVRRDDGWQRRSQPPLHGLSRPGISSASIVNCVAFATVNWCNCELLSYGNARSLAQRHPCPPFQDGARRSHRKCSRRGRHFYKVAQTGRQKGGVEGGNRDALFLRPKALTVCSVPVAILGWPSGSYC